MHLLFPDSICHLAKADLDQVPVSHLMSNTVTARQLFLYDTAGSSDLEGQNFRNEIARDALLVPGPV